jgi:hypothetical protein
MKKIIMIMNMDEDGAWKRGPLQFAVGSVP